MNPAVRVEYAGRNIICNRGGKELSERAEQCQALNVQTMLNQPVCRQSIGSPTYCLEVTIKEQEISRMEVKSQCKRKTLLSICTMRRLITRFRPMNRSSIFAEF